jgi:hypothetical protein
MPLPKSRSVGLPWWLTAPVDGKALLSGQLRVARRPAAARARRRPVEADSSYDPVPGLADAALALTPREALLRALADASADSGT